VRPGLTENELWSVMHQGVIALQETGEHRMGENKLVALDTDVVGWTSENRATTAPSSPA